MITFFGSLFPDAGGGTFWGPLFPDGYSSPGVFVGYGPPGVYTLAGLQNGFTVSYRWVTDVIKTRSGREQRISRNDAPKQSYAGNAILLGDTPRATRRMLAEYAAIGSPLLLALPHEELVLRANASGTTVYVFAAALALTDWKNPGQRVVVVRENDDGDAESIDAVVQSTTTDSITLDIDPGALGLAGGRIMPGMAIYLEPQQDFPRFQVNAEIWSLKARAMIFDFVMTKATLDLGPLTASAAFDDVTLVSQIDGYDGNGLAFWMDPNVSYGATGQLIEGASLILFGYEAGVTTLGDLATALSTSSKSLMTGTFDPDAVIELADAIPLPGVSFSGATAVGPVGNGATVTEHADRPVWDRLIKTEGMVVDGVHAGTTIVDFDGVPYTIGMQDKADWFRAIALSSPDRAEFQWWKLFLSTVKGRQKAFWLPTWRDDLTWISSGVDVITIANDDFSTWWPDQRQHIQIEQADGVITYVEVTAATVDGDEIELDIGVTLSGSAVTRISWLELCRFEQDEFSLTWDQRGFKFGTVARGVQG